MKGADWVLEAHTGINVDSATVTVSVGFEAADVTVINYDHYDDYFLTKFQIRGYPFRFNSNFSAKTEMTASQSLYGIRERTFNAKFLANAQFAKTYANRVAAMYSNVTPYGRASVRNSFPSMLSLQRGDLASFVHSLSGVNSKHLVKEISHTVNAEQDGWIHEMDLQFELARTKVSSLL